MPLDLMERLPDEARVWVFGTGRPLSVEEEDTLLTAVDAHLEAWAAHGHPLRSAREWREGRFLIVAVDEATAPPTGCSIDALVHQLRRLETALGVTLVEHGAVWYRTEEGLPARVGRADFKRLIQTGDAHGETTVFDDTVVRLRQIRGGEFERPAGRGWHARAFGLSE